MDFGILGRHLPERSSREVQVGQGHQAEHLRCIFEQPTIPHLAIAELAFNNSEHVLDLGTYDAIFLITPLLRSRQNPSRLALTFHRPSGPSLPGRPLALVADIALVAKYDRIVHADQIVGHLCIMDLACCGLDRVHETTFGVHANMRLHSEIPLITFL